MITIKKKRINIYLFGLRLKIKLIILLFNLKKYHFYFINIIHQNYVRSNYRSKYTSIYKVVGRDEDQ